MRHAAQFERPLPQNVEAERSILGAILLDNSALNVAAGFVNPSDFIHDHHRRIYRQMKVLAENRQPIDLVPLVEQFGRSGELESVDGEAYVAQLMDGMPRVTNVEHYARIVKEKALFRSLIFATDAIQKKAFAANDNVGLVLDEAKRSIHSLGTLDGLSQSLRCGEICFTPLKI